ELSVFWAEHELGEMNLLKSEQTGISVTGCYNCGKMPAVGKTSCTMEEGIMEGVLSSKLKSAFKVKEIECYGTGHDNCKFIIEKVEV
ncbi:MAG: hypothetical protein QSU88_00820, partial [Candidatus Methanoperedens sp.]|nr:hypothetical protein [Candidatus Methanoperedens sp.]